MARRTARSSPNMSSKYIEDAERWWSRLSEEGKYAYWKIIKNLSDDPPVYQDFLSIPKWRYISYSQFLGRTYKQQPVVAPMPPVTILPKVERPIPIGDGIEIAYTQTYFSD